MVPFHPHFEHNFVFFPRKKLEAKYGFLHEIKAGEGSIWFPFRRGLRFEATSKEKYISPPPLAGYWWHLWLGGREHNKVFYGNSVASQSHSLSRNILVAGNISQKILVFANKAVEMGHHHHPECVQQGSLSFLQREGWICWRPPKKSEGKGGKGSRGDDEDVLTSQPGKPASLASFSRIKRTKKEGREEEKGHFSRPVVPSLPFLSSWAGKKGQGGHGGPK